MVWRTGLARENKYSWVGYGCVKYGSGIGGQAQLRLNSFQKEGGRKAGQAIVLGKSAKSLQWTQRQVCLYRQQYISKAEQSVLDFVPQIKNTSYV